MAMPQRGNTIEAIKRLEPPSRVRYGVSGALLEYAVMHGDEAERIREERTGGCVGFAEGRRSRGDRPTGTERGGGWPVERELHEMHC
jgi:hypothetical protein